FLQTKRRSSNELYGEKRFKKYARRTNLEYEGPSENEDLYETDEEQDRVYRVPAKPEKSQSKKMSGSEQQTGQSGLTSPASQTETMKVLNETRDLVQALVTQIKDQVVRDTSKSGQPDNATQSGRRKIVCYGCQQPGHIIRDCPHKTSNRLDKNGGIGANQSRQHQARLDGNSRGPLN
ncbi:MAG: CCHC-type zinc finger protein, partial [Candidatus Thiodiazotropha taylori]|nr:CCHC-type zinc finger protein [Candidatus Thiodiazotropha taylori]MCW4336959.1 CCHC-type zinc finger protein [Candidatus Thiodiazotropha endolucinida]